MHVQGNIEVFNPGISVTILPSNKFKHTGKAGNESNLFAAYTRLEF